MIPVSPKPRTFIRLHLLVVISVSLVHKYSKCGEEILEMTEFIRYLSRTPLIFLNASQSQIHSCFIIYRIQMPIILQQHICCTTYPRNLCIRFVKNKLFFYGTPNRHFSYKYDVLHGDYVCMAYIML